MSSKLSKIWHRGTLLYSYFEFNVYFTKISVIHIFGHILFQNLKFDTGVHCCKLIMILMFSFSKFCYLSNFELIWAKSNVLHIDRNLTKGDISTCWLQF